MVGWCPSGQRGCKHGALWGQDLEPGGPGLQGQLLPLPLGVPCPPQASSRKSIPGVGCSETTAYGSVTCVDAGWDRHGWSGCGWSWLRRPSRALTQALGHRRGTEKMSGGDCRGLLREGGTQRADGSSLTSYLSLAPSAGGPRRQPRWLGEATASFPPSCTCFCHFLVINMNSCSFKFSQSVLIRFNLNFDISDSQITSCPLTGS